MPRQWSEHEVEKMLDYRDQGLTEAKIADKLTLIFMRTFTASAVNRKIRDLKKIGYIEANTHTGRWKSPSGQKREGEKHERQTSAKPKTKKRKQHGR